MTQRQLDKLNGVGRTILTWSSVIGVIIAVGACAGMVKDNTKRSLKNEISLEKTQKEMVDRDTRNEALIIEMSTDIKWIKQSISTRTTNER